MMKIVMLVAALLAFGLPSVCLAEDDPKKQAELLEKIEKLEQQINELRALKLLKQSLPVKRDQCMKVVGVEGYCTCVVEKLPANVDYRQFVQILLTPAAELGYDKMSGEQKKDVDDALVAWAKCVDYKAPKPEGGFDKILQRDTLF
jgi:hypothetical protein